MRELPMSTLKNIFRQDDEKNKQQDEEKHYRCRFTVNNIIFDSQSTTSDDINYLSLVKVLNTKTKQIRDLAKSEKSEKALKPNEKLCFFVQLVCKDSSLVFTKDFVQLNILQEQGKDGFFTGIEPSDLLQGKKSEQTLVRIAHSL